MKPASVLRPQAESNARCDESLAGSALEQVEAYYRELQLLRRSLPPSKWREYCTGLGRQHATKAIARSGPITRGFFQKIRGYAGDPETLDLIYGAECAGDELPDPDRAIYRWESKLAFCEGMRARRELANSHLTELFEACPNARVMAVGSGHLRETAGVLPGLNANKAEFVAVDADPLALQFLEIRFGDSPITRIQSTPSALVRKLPAKGKFDFIYALHLFDSLHPLEAERILRILFSMLRPGGRLLAACCSPALPDAAYVEACMDWWPVCRDEEEMARLTRSIPPDEIAAQFVFYDDLCSTVFLEIEASMSH